MPVFEITSPDGKKYRVTGPDGSTADQALAQVQKQAGAAPPPETSDAQEERSLGGFVKNVGKSAVQFGKNVAQPFLHPVDTADALAGLGSGLIQKGAQAAGLKSETDDIEAADVVGGMLKDRYGSPGKIATTMYEDPVGVAADASALLTGGGGLVASAPGMIGKVGEATRTVGRMVDPLSVPIQGAKLAGHGAAELIGGLGTHTGAESLRTAARSGAESGPAGQAFRDNMRGTAPMEETVQVAQQALGKIRQERGQAYRSGMIPVANDKTVLNFNDIDNALANVATVKSFKGQNISPKTQDIRLEIGEAIRDWKTLNPAEFHTAEGLDALKQKIGDIREGTERGTPARVVADQAYNAIKQTIVKQAPEYAKVMKGYEEATKQIKDIEKTLSLNPNASVDTALRKLQSVLRDNVNTSFGRRRELAQYLTDAGAPHLMERLAGQALKPWTPRGLAKMVGTELLAAGAGAFGAGATGAGGAAAATLPFMSPRIMGEAAHAAGRASNLPGRQVGGTAFQAGRIADQLDPREMVKNDAKDALRDKSGYTKSQVEALRSVASGSAPIDTIMTVKRLLESKNYQGVQ